MIHSSNPFYLSCIRPYNNTRRILLTAPEDLVEALNKAARKYETNRSDVMRLALSEFVHQSQNHA